MSVGVMKDYKLKPFCSYLSAYDTHIMTHTYQGITKMFVAESFWYKKASNAKKESYCSAEP